MAVTKLSNSGIKTGVLKYDSMLAGNPAFDPAATWLIQRVTAAGGETSISFTSIPSTYQHLQIRYIARNQSTSSAFSSTPLLTFNNDSGTNYVGHYLWGDGSSASAGSNGTSTNNISLNSTSLRDTSASGIFGACIVDIYDYKSTTKNKTVRAFGGVDTNTAATSWRVSLISGLWMSTSAITSIEIAPGVSTWKAGSTIALYGIKGV